MASNKSSVRLLAAFLVVLLALNGCISVTPVPSDKSASSDASSSSSDSSSVSLPDSSIDGSSQPQPYSDAEKTERICNLTRLIDRYLYKDLAQYAQKTRAAALEKWNFATEIPTGHQFLGEIEMKFNSDRCVFILYREEAELNGKTYQYIWWVKKQAELSDGTSSWIYSEARDSKLIWQAPGLDSNYSYYGVADLDEFYQSVLKPEIDSHGYDLVLYNSVEGLSIPGLGEMPFITSDMQGIREAYRQVVNELEQQYGVLHAGDPTKPSGDYVYGLVLAIPYVFDPYEDETPSLVCAYSTQDDNPEYMIRVYHYLNGKAELLYEGKGYNSFFSVDPSVPFLRGLDGLRFLQVLGTGDASSLRYVSVINGSLKVLDCHADDPYMIGDNSYSSAESFDEAMSQLVPAFCYRFEADVFSLDEGFSSVFVHPTFR